jgi:hypothetical protein
MSRGQVFCVRRGVPMLTFDLAGVREFTADISARMPSLPEPVEGMECAKMEDLLRRYAELCREFCGRVRAWGHAVFSGRVDFDPEVERLLREGGSDVHSQATWAFQCGQVIEREYSTLEGMSSLRYAIDELGQLLQGWVTPKLAVGPAAKRWRYPDQAATEEERRRVASLLAAPASRESNGAGPQALAREVRTS